MITRPTTKITFIGSVELAGPDTKELQSLSSQVIMPDKHVNLSTFSVKQISILIRNSQKWRDTVLEAETLDMDMVAAVVAEVLPS